MLAYDSFLDTNLPIYPTIVQPHYLNLNSLSLYKTGVLISINPETQEAANTLKTQARSQGWPTSQKRQKWPDGKVKKNNQGSGPSHRNERRKTKGWEVDRSRNGGMFPECHCKSSGA